MADIRWIPYDFPELETYMANIGESKASVNMIEGYLVHASLTCRLIELIYGFIDRWGDSKDQNFEQGIHKIYFSMKVGILASLIYDHAAFRQHLRSLAAESSNHAVRAAFCGSNNPERRLFPLSRCTKFWSHCRARGIEAWGLLVTGNCVQNTSRRKRVGMYLPRRLCESDEMHCYAIFSSPEDGIVVYNPQRRDRGPNKLPVSVKKILSLISGSKNNTRIVCGRQFSEGMCIFHSIQFLIRAAIIYDSSGSINELNQDWQPGEQRCFL